MREGRRGRGSRGEEREKGGGRGMDGIFCRLYSELYNAFQGYHTTFSNMLNHMTISQSIVKLH